VSEFGDVLKAIVLRRIESDSLTLPAMPVAAVKCTTLLRNPNVSGRQIAAVLETDPILVAQVLKLANSAAYGGMPRTQTIEQAVSRVGLARLRALLIEASAHRLFESRDKAIAEASRVVWEHSVGVGLLSRDVAAMVLPRDTETCYLAGLLHDVGKPVVAAMLLEAERKVAVGRKATWIGDGEWAETVNQYHRMVGVALAEKWNLAEALTKCIRDCSEYDPGDRLSAPNIVRFSNAVAKVNGMALGAVDEDEVQPIVMIGTSMLGIDEDVVGRVTKGLSQRVKQHLGN
jgi:putative nucleotidyltransferase with HDIG domain